MNKIIALIIIFIFFPIITIISLMIYFSDGLPILFKQKRVGKNNVIFMMYKFRTMRKNTPEVATHLLENPNKYLLPIGGLLRKLSLDEFPNLINILKGDMYFVGPRPALYNQYDLIEMRSKVGVHELMPGVTGWAQINGRDEIPLNEKVKLDHWYKENYSFCLNIKIIILTIIKSINGKDISH